VVIDVIAQVPRLAEVLKNFRKVLHVVVHGVHRLGRVHPVVVLAPLAEAAHLFVLLVVL